MENFSYQNETKIIFGKDTTDKLAEELNAIKPNKVLLHYGTSHIKKSGLYDQVIAQLKETAIPFVELGGVVPNPHLELVQEGIELCRKEDADFILAVGGGSVIDSAKAIAAGVPYDGDVWDFYDGKASVEEALPIASILTIPAAGSESSMFTVITNTATKRKYGMGSPLLRPVFSILDPALTATLPDYQTACGASDMLAHTLERYFVPVKHVDVTDRLCEVHMGSIMKNAKLVLREPTNYDYRAEILLAGYIAHNDWLDVGRTRGDWATHAIEHELSALYDIAHGAGLAIIFPAWMKHVYKEDVKRFSMWARNVFGISAYDDEEATLLGISALEQFYKEIGMPTRLSEADLPADKIDEMATNATKNGPLGSFKKLSKEDVVAILNLAK